MVVWESILCILIYYYSLFKQLKKMFSCPERFRKENLKCCCFRFSYILLFLNYYVNVFEQ